MTNIVFWSFSFVKFWFYMGRELTGLQVVHFNGAPARQKRSHCGDSPLNRLGEAPLRP